MQDFASTSDHRLNPCNENPYSPQTPGLKGSTE